jgi:hypothetical protein
MSAPARRLLIVGFVALTVAPIARYGVHTGAGPRFSEPFVPRLDTEESAESDAELERRRQVYWDRIAMKQHVVRELVAGRLTLSQAAARFRAIDVELPLTRGPPRPAAGAGEDERVCRNVMARAVDWVAKNLPEATAQVAERLETELEQLRGPDGIVRLPY